MTTKQKQTVNPLSPKRNKIPHPGIHAKTKVSNTKHNKNYQKPYRGQGK